MYILLYLFQLIFNYFVIRAVYIKDPYMIDAFPILFGLISFIGCLIGILYFPNCFNDYSKKKIVDFIFMVKKSVIVPYSELRKNL